MEALLKLHRKDEEMEANNYTITLHVKQYTDTWEDGNWLHWRNPSKPVVLRKKRIKLEMGTDYTEETLQNQFS